jgi:hypothetical protein
MTSLPPGCTVTRSIFIDIEELTDDMVSWFMLIGGTAVEETFFNSDKGNISKHWVIKYGKSKFCHYHANGTKQVRLHFMAEDAPIATSFILKYQNQVIYSNLTEQFNVQDLL